MVARRGVAELKMLDELKSISRQKKGKGKISG
jgi:hypothetical protein